MKTLIFLAFAFFYHISPIACNPQFTAVQAPPTATPTRPPHLPGRPFRYEYYPNRLSVYPYIRTIFFLDTVSGFAQRYPADQVLPYGEFSFETGSYFGIKVSPGGKEGEGLTWGDTVACVAAVREYYTKSQSSYGVDVDILDGFFLEGKAHVGESEGGEGAGVDGAGGGGGLNLTAPAPATE